MNSTILQAYETGVISLEMAIEAFVIYILATKGRRYLKTMCGAANRQRKANLGCPVWACFMETAHFQLSTGM